MEETPVIILLHISEGMFSTRAFDRVIVVELLNIFNDWNPFSATGLNLRNGNVLLTASLGGNLISSEVVPSSKNTIFDLNLIWKTDKKAIKRFVLLKTHISNILTNQSH